MDPISVLFPIAERRESLSNKGRGYAMLAKDVILRSVVLMKTVRLPWRLRLSRSRLLPRIIIQFSIEGGIRAQMVSVVD